MKLFLAGALAFAIALTAMPSWAAPASTGSANAKAPAATAGPNPLLLTPAKMIEKAPDTYRARFVTSKGTFEVEVTRAWSPNGADRFYNLVKDGFFDGTRFFRDVAGFMVQFGINGDPKVNAAWQDPSAQIKDDPVVKSNKRGFITFAKTGAPDSRTTQVFINFVDNGRLDGMGFSPFGQIAGNGMAVIDSLYSGYGEGAPSGNGPDQGRIQSEGNAYLMKDFPKLDYIKKATIVTGGAAHPAKAAGEKAPAKTAPGK